MTQHLKVRGQFYTAGDLIVIPPPEQATRGDSGRLDQYESLFLLDYDEVQDCLSLHPLDWTVASRMFGERLAQALLYVRPKGFAATQEPRRKDESNASRPS